MLGSVRGIATGVLRVVNSAGFEYRIVPGRSYMHTCVYFETSAKTGAAAESLSVQVSDESWMPNSRMTVGPPVPAHCR